MKVKETGDEFFLQNEIAGLIETIKRHEQDILDLKDENRSLRNDIAARDTFIKNQSNLVEELKQQVIGRGVHITTDTCETSGGHEQ